MDRKEFSKSLSATVSESAALESFKQKEYQKYTNKLLFNFVICFSLCAFFLPLFYYIIF